MPRYTTKGMRLYFFLSLLVLPACANLAPRENSAVPAAHGDALGHARSQGIYRLPYANGTRISVFDDARTHRPVARVDLVGEPRQGRAHRIVAAADGVVMAIQDSFSEQQTGRAAADCRNNYVWIAHPNGEWSLYSHMEQGTTTGAAGLRAGQSVRAGQYLGDEGSVGCSMLSHLHFEIAVPPTDDPIDQGGFVNDNTGSHRNRIPRFCRTNSEVRKEAEYEAKACP
jgi:murein DD-endopeptidase MepM/ murein hydrolase activator NlpD